MTTGSYIKSLKSFFKSEFGFGCHPLPPRPYKCLVGHLFKTGVGLLSLQGPHYGFPDYPPPLIVKDHTVKLFYFLVWDPSLNPIIFHVILCQYIGTPGNLATAGVSTSPMQWGRDGVKCAHYVNKAF